MSELAAQRLWPGADLIGRTIVIRPSGGREVEMPPFHEAMVVGMSRDIVPKLHDGVRQPVVYFPDSLRAGTLIAVRGRGSPEQSSRLLEAALARAPGAEHGACVIALEDAISWESYPQEATSWLAMLLGGVAVLLTTSGMYSVLSYLISQSTREIGIRIALGASRSSVAAFMLSGCARLSAAGVAMGMLLGIGLLRYLSSDVGLFIDVNDVLAIVVPLVVVALTVLLAALGPVRRAWHVDPPQALRSE